MKKYIILLTFLPAILNGMDGKKKKVSADKTWECAQKHPWPSEIKNICKQLRKRLRDIQIPYDDESEQRIAKERTTERECIFTTMRILQANVNKKNVKAFFSFINFNKKQTEENGEEPYFSDSETLRKDYQQDESGYGSDSQFDYKAEEYFYTWELEEDDDGYCTDDEHNITTLKASLFNFLLKKLNECNEEVSGISRIRKLKT